MLRRPRGSQGAKQKSLEIPSSVWAVSYQGSQAVCRFVCKQFVDLRGKAMIVFWTHTFLKYVIPSRISPEPLLRTHHQDALVLNCFYVCYMDSISLSHPSPRSVDRTQCSGLKHFYALCWLPFIFINTAHLLFLSYPVIWTIYKMGQAPEKEQNILIPCNVETINRKQYSRVNIECDCKYREAKE